ncbi:Uma2 family endonuclease [Sphaerospermopsis sp. FACHB-1094]|uniref:Uma2 family endonuclease n=1 Tax=Sphaerospermopsis sp. FACHB-1094 TaxID=2692861 RepID=UPI0016858261|nr:Uma2 family endonuclease [Sphaerospermopsis sp. FACHB-1094]MBD2130977.1 Uma2 family endonuclease [Sphaerospermopsis sp. FACHB-1094]
MESTQAVINPTTPTNQDIHTPKFTLPDHTQLPDSDGTFVKNFQEHPQSIVLTSSIEPILQKIHPDGNYCIGQDSGIYWRLTDPPEKGAEAPDWFYVPNVPPKLNGDYRRSYVLWKEFVAPLIAIEFVSGNGEEERDKTPPSKTAKAGKFWVYEQAIRIPFYGIFEARKALLEVYRLVDGSYQKIQLNERGHFSIPPMGVELGLIEDDGVPWVRWWDDGGNLLLTGDERAIVEKQARLEAEEIAQQAKLAQQQAEEIAQQERQKKEKLAAYLRSLGVNPDDI